MRADRLPRRLEGDRYRIGGELWTPDEVVRLFRSGALLHTRTAVLVQRCDGRLDLVRRGRDVAGVDLLERVAVGHEADPRLVDEVDLRVRLTSYRMAT